MKSSCSACPGFLFSDKPPADDHRGATTAVGPGKQSLPPAAAARYWAAFWAAREALLELGRESEDYQQARAEMVAALGDLGVPTQAWGIA